MISESIATRPRGGRVQTVSPGASGCERVLIGFCSLPSVYSYFQSGSSECFRSHRGRRLRTAGIEAKLYSGGGEVVAHSSVQASQGSLPATAPAKYDWIRL